MNTVVNERMPIQIPTRELERRWAKVRAAMKAVAVDSLIIQNDNQYLGGYVRYFTDFPAFNAYPVSVIFPADEEMTIITHGGPPSPPGPPDWAIRGIKTRLAYPYFRTAYYTNKWDAEATVKTIKARGDKRVGVIGLGCMQVAYFDYVRENLPGVEFIDVTDTIDKIKAVKSEDELVFVRRAMETQDMAYAVLPTIVRPGKYEYQIRNEVIRILSDLGSEEQLVMIGSAPQGNLARHLPSFFQNRRIEAGDSVIVMIEPNGPGGYYGELGRTFCLGAPSKEQIAVFDDAVAAQKFCAGLLKPGAKPAEIFRQSNEFWGKLGYPAEGRVFAHGQGYDLVERPLIRDEEEMELAAGMVFCVHPPLAGKHAFACLWDDYLVTATGPERLHKTPQSLIILGV